MRTRWLPEDHALQGHVGQVLQDGAHATGGVKDGTSPTVGHEARWELRFWITSKSRCQSPSYCWPMIQQWGMERRNPVQAGPWEPSVS